MLLLALDTSTRHASIALCADDELHGEYTWHVEGNHSVDLLANIRHLLAECHFTLQQVDALAVATGPGSFNGIRVALATAKALAFALKKPLVGISTLDSIAAQQQQWHGPVCAALEAGRAELYAASYRFSEHYISNNSIVYQMQQLSEYLMLKPQQLASHLREQAHTWFAVPGERQLPPFLFCGEISATSRQALQTHMQGGILFAPGVLANRQASVLAQLAFQRLHEGKKDDPLSLEALYLRRPSITKSTRKQPLLGEKRGTGQDSTERDEGALRH